uniref:Col_cuticle_N domain-containing protein n=1 Tax=Steinernema glaseri TaxID=37863 RepID=A0A1I8AF32_9BILA
MRREFEGACDIGSQFQQQTCTRQQQPNIGLELCVRRLSMFLLPTDFYRSSTHLFILVTTMSLGTVLIVLSVSFVASLPFYEVEGIGMPNAVQCFPTPCYAEDGSYSFQSSR